MKEQTPEKKDGQAAANGPSIVKVALIAVGIGALAGAAGIYATGGLSGNAMLAGDAGGKCEAAIALGAELKPLMTGEIAAMAARDRETDLSALPFNDADGKAMTLADTGGKPRLVNLWATWCAPCRAEMPALDRLQADKGGEDFEVIAVSLDNGSDDKPRAFLKEIGVEHLDLYHDPSNGAFTLAKKQALTIGLPATMLVDAENCVVANMAGPAEWASEDAYRLIDAVRAKAGDDRPES